MGRGPKAAAERHEEAGKGSSHPQNVGSSTHFPTRFMESFTQGMQSFRSSLNENVQGMHQRLDGCESCLSIRDKEIQEFGNDMRRFFSQAAQSEDQGHQDDAPGYTRSTSLVYHAGLTHALTNLKPYLDSNAQRYTKCGSSALCASKHHHQPHGLPEVHQATPSSTNPSLASYLTYNHNLTPKHPNS
ncbi:hypothetical protein PIB30_080596 [Stylosanthes scabra]|uniref:Uncharacterized protein n=1 Tax=Stylosanthes scabra TaxID=79078 RepID=A0ABU6RRH5_9FABA|nr:hypothetical protein [Stylosanthes scabra]